MLVPVLSYCRVIRFSNRVDLWVIKIKSPWSLAHVLRRDHVNKAWNADYAARTCEKSVYSIVKETTFYDYKTWFVWEIHEVRKGLWAFFLGCTFRMLIGWAGKLRSRGKIVENCKRQTMRKESMRQYLHTKIVPRHKCAEFSILTTIKMIKYNQFQKPWESWTKYMMSDQPSRVMICQEINWD